LHGPLVLRLFIEHRNPDGTGQILDPENYVYLYVKLEPVSGVPGADRSACPAVCRGLLTTPIAAFHPDPAVFSKSKGPN